MRNAWSPADGGGGRGDWGTHSQPRPAKRDGFSAGSSGFSGCSGCSPSRTKKSRSRQDDGKIPLFLSSGFLFSFAFFFIFARRRQPVDVR